MRALRKIDYVWMKLRIFVNRYRFEPVAVFETEMFRKAFIRRHFEVGPQYGVDAGERHSKGS